MTIVTFLSMNLIVIISAFMLTYKLLKIAGFIDSSISLFVLYFAQIVFTELLLGIFGGIFIQNLILVNLGILIIAWLVTRDKEPTIKFIGTGKGRGIEKDEFFQNKAVLLLIAAILSFGIIKVLINLANPPFGWDSLNYHFTFAVEWLKHGNLNIPITISDDPSPTYYPINGSLYYLWLIFPFKSVFMADLGQVPFFILAGLAVYGICRKLYINRELSFYATGLFLIIPNYFKQLQVAYVDVMVGALFLTCVNFLFLLNEKLNLKNALIYSLSFGLLLGTKTVALPYCVLLFIPFGYLLSKNVSNVKMGTVPKRRGQSPFLQSPFLLFFIFISTCIIWGGFSYIRNFIDTGNPLYPLDFKIFGKTLFNGVMSKNIYAAHFKAEDYSLFKLLFGEGLGIQTLFFIFPAIFLAAPIVLAKVKKRLSFNLLYFLFLPVMIYLVYRYVIPLANTRYLYPLLGCGIIASFYTISIFKIPGRIIKILVAICILASMAELAKRQELIISTITTILFFFLLVILIKNIKKSPLTVTPLSLWIFSIFAIFSLIILNNYYQKNEYTRYIKMVKYSGFWPDATKAWDWLNSHTTGNNIAYIGRPVPFPLYGSGFKNSVYYVSVNKTDPAKLHYYRGSHYDWGYDFLSQHKSFEAKNNYRFAADYAVWLNNLLRRDTDYLFVYSLHQTKEIGFPIEDSWAKINIDKFIPVFRNETVHIYKIEKIASPLRGGSQ